MESTSINFCLRKSRFSAPFLPLIPTQGPPSKSPWKLSSREKVFEDTTQNLGNHFIISKLWHVGGFHVVLYVPNTWKLCGNLVKWKEEGRKSRAILPRRKRKNPTSLNCLRLLNFFEIRICPKETAGTLFSCSQGITKGLEGFLKFWSKSCCVTPLQEILNWGK